MEKQFNCFLCNDRKRRAYFSVQKKIGWCHNCSSVISKKAYEKFFRVDLGDEEIDVEEEYYTDEEFELLQKKEKTFDIITCNLSPDAVSYMHKRIPVEIQQEITNMNLSLPEWQEFISMMFNNRIKFPCYSEDPSKKFWLARSYKNDQIPKVLFPREDMMGIGKSECLYINEFYLKNKEKIDKSGIRIIPVICEGEYDALSVFYRHKGAISIGVGILGKVLSAKQLKLIKDYFKCWSPDSEVWLCLDGDDKSTKEEEKRNMKLQKLKTIERLESHFNNVRVLQLQEDDPNSILQREKTFLWIKKYVA